jgi:hypothetical protein
MKTVNIILSIVFLLFAALQYNDVDPYIWVPIYLLAAFLCWQASKGKFQAYLYVTGMLICLAYGAYLFFDKNGVLAWASEHAAESLVHSMKAETPWIEESREFGGLLIVFISLLINYIILRKSTSAINLPASE